MGKLSDFFKNSYSRWNNISKGKKIAFGVSFLGLLVIVVYLAVSLGTTKYSVLFSNLDSNDAKTIMDKLKAEKVTNVKISGNTILVPDNMVDQLRLELASDITSGSKGWELFDTTSQFGTTDAEMKIKYQRALQGELEKTIKSFTQIGQAKVALVLPDESVFVKDSTPASASVTLIMKPGQALKDDQVRAIVALISGSVKGLPKENVQIVDDKMRLLTDGLFDKDKVNLTEETDKQKQMKSDYEKDLENKVMEQLGKPFKSKVTVKVNVDLDFDAVQSKITTVDPKGTPVSEKTVKDSNPGSTNNLSQSPIDNNMSNTAPTQDISTSGNTTHEEVTTNYEVGKSETTTIKAPGSVKRITASVIIDGNLDDNLKTQVTGLVANAIGFDNKRGDTISVEGLKFDDTDAQNAQKAVDELNQFQQKENRMKLYKEMAAGAGALVGLIVLILMLRKSRKKSAQEEQLEAITASNGINVLIGEDEQKPLVEFKPIDFDDEVASERKHLEKEIKRYASEKPEQVADIIKSWLAEDER